MISIILEASEEAKVKATKDGFRTREVLVRFEPVVSNEDNRRKLEIQVRDRIKPYQFLVADYWGMGPD